jgi:hypothetical protein
VIGPEVVELACRCAAIGRQAAVTRVGSEWCVSLAEAGSCARRVQDLTVVARAVAIAETLASPKRVKRAQRKNLRKVRRKAVVRAHRFGA